MLFRFKKKIKLKVLIGVVLFKILFEEYVFIWFRSLSCELFKKKKIWVVNKGCGIFICGVVIVLWI